MSSVKSPVEKKRLAYGRDHFDRSEYRHGFRKSWPLKKARANRSYRRRVDQCLSRVQARGDLENNDPTVARREKIRKWRPVSLRERVKLTLDRRARSVGAKCARRSRRIDWKPRINHSTVPQPNRRLPDFGRWIASLAAAAPGIPPRVEIPDPERIVEHPAVPKGLIANSLRTLPGAVISARYRHPKVEWRLHTASGGSQLIAESGDFDGFRQALAEFAQKFPVQRPAGSRRILKIRGPGFRRVCEARLSRKSATGFWLHFYILAY